MPLGKPYSKKSVGKNIKRQKSRGKLKREAVSIGESVSKKGIVTYRKKKR